MRPAEFAELILCVVAVSAPLGCRPAQPPAPITELIVTPAAALPSDAQDPAWSAAPELVAKLILQDLVEPRLMKASTPDVRVRGLSDGRELALRLEWSDATRGDLPGAARFSDSCAVQIPAKTEPTIPAPQMGEPGRPVEIVMWNAAWQAVVDGRGDSIRDLYPRASIDHYPFEAASLEKGSAAQGEMAARYAPARSLGNTMAGPRTTPVQDLMAEGPGTLAPRTPSASTGKGVRTNDGWAVVIRRPFPEGVSERTGTQIAFAVWDGAHEEVGARKMRTGWIPVVLKARP